MSNCINCKKELAKEQEKYCSTKCANTTNNKKFLTMEAQEKRGKERKLYLVNRAGGCCNRCGYSNNLAALCFHHMDPKTKDFELNSRSLSNRKIDSLEKEADKCELLCHNCHMEEHYPSYTKESVEKEHNVLTLPKKASNTKIDWPSDKELSKLIWSKPMKEVALKLGVSVSAVSLRTTRKNISKPPKNYWANKSEIRKK